MVLFWRLPLPLLLIWSGASALSVTCPFGGSSGKQCLLDIPRLAAPVTLCAGNEVCVKTERDQGVCCPVPDDVRCYGDQLPYYKKGDNCEDLSVPHPTKKEVCCQIFISKKYREDTKPTLVRAVDQNTPCTLEKGCGKEKFCGDAVLNQMRQETQGNPMRCFHERLQVPPMEKYNTDTAGTCLDDSNCVRSTDLTSGTHVSHVTGCVPVDGQDHHCHHRKCLFGIAPRSHQQKCVGNKDCEKNELCVEVLAGIGRHCCPVGDKFKCHGDQLPDFEEGRFQCPPGMLSHPLRSEETCCQPFIYTNWKKRAEVLPVRQDARCEKSSECLMGEFCGRSTLRNTHDQLIGTPKHCYKIPMLGSAYAKLTDEDDIVVCNDWGTCTTKLLSQCKTTHGFNICYESNCPLWNPKKTIDSSKYGSACSATSQCQADAHCVSLFDNEKRCCPIETNMLCPGGVLPVMDGKDQAVKTCDVTKHFVHSAEGRTFCCDKPHSKDFEGQGLISPKEDSKPCKKNKDCPWDYFCGVSVIDGARKVVEGYAITDPIRHCYSRPSFGSVRAMTKKDNQGLEDCAKAEDCRTNNPAVCEAGTINRKSTRKICFESKCPFTAPLTSKATCSAQSSCKAGQMCVNVIGSVKHCCPVPDEFKCHTTQLPFYKPESTKCKDGSKPHPKQSGFCCQDYIYKRLGDSTPVAPVRPEECVDENQCAKGEFCGASTVAKMSEYLQGSPRHCYKRPVLGDGKAYLDQGELILCDKVENCKGDHIRSCKKFPAYNKNICFRAYCPLWLKENPLDRSKFAKVCQDDSSCPGAFCVTLTGIDKHCCPIDPKLTCPGGVLPVMGAGNKPLTACDASKHFVHSVGGLKLCCDKPHSKDFEALGEISPKEVSKPCKKNSECGSGYFCGVSVINGARMNVQGYAATDIIWHCYERPTFESIPATTLGDKVSGLPVCDAHVKCGIKNPAVCAEGKINGKAVRKYCFESPCPFTMPLTTKNLCTSQSSCKAGEMCVNVLGSVKHCCPVPDNLKCHKTQFPFYKRGATNCQQGSTKQASGSCCQDYIYKVFGDASPIKPPGTKECTKDSCANGEFCGASTLSNMAEYVQGSPKHCYKRPVRGDGKASLVNGELVLCPSDTHCRGILIHSCKKVTEYNDKQLCFESNCPLWLKTGLIDSSKFSKACTSDSACPNGLCTSLFGNEKRCCPIEPTLTCPGGVLPVMGAGNKPLTACDASKHFVHSVGGLKLCCDKPHSKDFEALGEISPRDDSETCKKNEDCIKGENGYFCGVSLIDGARIKVEGYAITDPIRHCYKRPSFQNRWAMIRLENQELEDCEKAEDCRTNNPAICEKGTLDRKTTRKICFEKQCPFTAPLTSKATCSAQSSCKAGQMCVNVIGSVKHCCPVPDDFKCHTSQLPYKPGSTECKDGSKAHTKQTGFCCQDYIYKGTGDSSPVAPVRPQECTKESECGKGEFCGASTLAKMGEYLQGSPRHCYKRPVRGDGKASLVTGDLVFCTADTDCPGSLIKSCKPDSNYKPNICFESNCPLWLEKNPIDSSKYSQLCYNKPSACSLGSHCVSLLTNEKRCCPVEPTFLCPGGNLPVLGGDDKPLTTCDSTIHFVHTAGQTKLCCDMPIAKYLHDVNGETVLSKNEKVPCSTNTQCGGGYFCAESLTKGSKKAFKVKVMHCYKQPVDGELIPGNGQSGLVICEKHEGCDVAKGQFCYNKFAHLKKGLCYKATCPLGGLPSGKFQACSKKSECGDNHCHPVNDKKYSGCCTVDTGNLCPGGIPPIELWKTECKGTNVFSRTIKNIPVCCIHVVSKKMKATGTLWRLTEKESDDIAAMNAKLCKTSGAVCPAGFFCDESVPLEGASLDVKPAVKHCYPVPKTHGASVAGPPTVLTTCTDSKECTGGQICDNKISLLDSRIKNTAGVCSVFKCPLSPSDTIRPTSFSKGINLCSTSADCGSGKHCHPVGSGNHYKACCDVAPQFLCPAGIPPIELWKTECKGANVFSRTINNIPVCCLHVVSKKMKATGTLWRLTEKGSDDIPAMDAKLCKTSGDICDAGFFCDESVPLEGDSLGVAVKHCYPVPKTHGISVAGPPAQLTTCTDSKECTGGQICDNKISLLDNRIKNTAGVCSVFKCPLSTSHINRPTSFSKGINLCSSLADCESGKHCHPVGSGQHYKACCDIAPEFLCPAGIPPTELWNSECKGENIFSRVLNSVPACCLRVVSKTMKATGTLWHLAEEESEEIAAMELRVCRTSGDICDAGFFCDESVSMEGGDLGVKHCYPVPKTHGVSVVGPPTQLTTCTDSKECTGGQICDNKISLLDNRIKNTAGVCSTFKCPLSSSYISRPSSFSEGIDLCSSATACESGKACHPIGSGELYKACCDVADEYLCPGGLFPTKVQKKMYYTEGDIMCDAGTFQYKWGTGDTPADGARCCPKVVSLDFLVEPVRSDETCQKNSDCQADEFCGTSTLEKNLSNPKTLEVNGVRVHHCYKSPKCSGTTVLSPNIGLKTCAKEYNTCDTDQICDLDLGATNQGRFAGKSGVCCHFQCSGSVPEGKAGDVGKPGKVCSCKGETKAQAFCDEDLQNDENTINVCEATGVEGTYRQCTYAREALKCFGEYEGPLRRKGSFEVVPCSNHVVCQGASKEIDGGASLCTSPLNPSTIPKICCKADLCPDHFTFRGNQDTCTNDGDCSKTEGSQQLKAKCQGDILGKSTAKHCCPFTDNVGRIEVVYPFDTKTHCTSLGDCLGDNRFCDSAKSTCIYNWRAADERKKSGSCTKDQMVCGGDKRVVCMTTELADTSSEPECFRHPFDECEKNKQCPFSGLSAGYCAPAVGTSEAEYAKAFRRCHTVPMGAAYLQLGLKECKDAADCTMDQSCIKDPAVATTPGFGYCKRNFEMTCRGSPQIDDSNGEVFTCSKNIDCGENGFCDMDITRPQSIPQDKGICCSRPICGGDLVLKEAGVKICTDDTGCSTEGGEICVKDIEKPENSAWKAGEGVCCKGTCPNIQHPEASVDVVPAGPICVANNCQNTTDTIRMCVGGTNVTFQRCCSYPRKTNICPAEFNGPVRNGFDAKPCATTKDCPAASECSGGFCCTQTFCSDKKTVKTAQLKCSKKSAEKDCRQPSGAVATCEKGRCCPKTHESKILEPFVTTTRCRHARDCPFNKMFCETSTRNCTYFGNNLKALETDKNCERGNLTCVGRDNLMGVCLYPDDNRNNLPSCYLNPMSESRIQENTEGDVDESAMVLGSILGIVAMALATVGLGGTLLAGYYKISKKNVRDKMRKAEKALNKDRKKKKPKKEELTGQSELWKNETSQSKVEQSQSQVDQSQMSQVESRASKKSGKSVKE